MPSAEPPAAPHGAQPFSARHERFRDGLSPDDWDEFTRSADDEQRVRFVYGRAYGGGEPTDGEEAADGGGKNGAETLALKRSGTECFQKSDYRAALDWYSRAVLRCPQTEEWLTQLSIIYANRSACLYHLRYYDLAVADIQQALDNGYPKDLRYKIYDRRAKCFLAMKQLKSAMESLETTVQALDDSNLSPDERRKRQLNVETTLSTITAKNGKNVQNEPVKSRRDWPKLYGEPSKTHPAASDVVSIEYDEALGRHAVARRDIPVGSVLLVERAYASVLLQEYSYSHCTHCFVKLMAPLPCPDCDRVAFCGEPCKRTALRSYHPIECPLLPTLNAASVSITCLMALRIITQKPLKYFIGLRPKLNHTYKSSGKHEQENYFNLYNLITHRETRSIRDVLHRSHLVAFYLSCLKKTNYFTSAVDQRQLTEDESFIGSLLLHHLMLLQFNSFEVSEIRRQGDKDQTVFIGGSVYPTLAMLNHSCDPSIVRYHRGTTVIVHNVRDLKAGEEITENYGPTFTLQPREERQQTLKTRYWFECSCIACCQDWPTWEQMQTNESLRIRCTNCQNAITVNTESTVFTVYCKVCSKTTNLLAALKVLQDTDEKYMAAKQLMDKQNYEKALPQFMTLLSLLHKHLVPPFKDYHLCQQAIGRCILSLGNTN